MKLVDKIENVGHYEVYNDCVLIGRDTRIKNGLISNGNQILKKSEEGLEILREAEYFYFSGFKDGILYYEKEGKPIHFSNTNTNLQITPEQHYFNPLHNLSNKDEIVITEMDKEFNQKYFFLNSIDFADKQECEVYPQLNNEKHYCRFHKKESWIEIVNKQTVNSYRKIDILINEAKMDRREKPLLDSNKIFIPLSSGKVAKFNCSNDSIEWVNQEFSEQYVSYNSNTEFLYQHFGRGINQISKLTGSITNSITFADSITEKFHSSGKIWCSNEYVITKDLISGKFCVFRANDLEPIGLEFVMKQGFADSNKTFQILGNRIFVLGMDNVLKEYKMN